MLRNAILSVVAVAAVASSAHAAVVLNEPFAYPDGALIGQGGWAITGTSVVNPILVASGSVTLNNNGQDAFVPLTASATLGSLASIETSFTANVLTTSATGDYFTHLSDSGTSNFYQRFFVKTGSTASNFVLGVGGSATPTVFGGDISLNASHTFDIVWNIVPGTTNDTYTITVDGVPYETAVATGAADVATTATISSFNLRQGTAGNAVTANIDDVVITETPAATPEPASLGLVAGASALVLRRRR